jgi:preprotein translocase subunit SecD
VLVDGERLRNASWAINQDTGQVVLTFRFDDTGASQFADATKANLGRRFAVVLDKKVITAPVIREPILGGSGEIEGNFTTQTANDLAARFRTSALPAPFHVLEVREIQQAETSN